MGSKPRSVWATKVMALGLDSAWFGDQDTAEPRKACARERAEAGVGRKLWVNM